jgi:hypothetical protein
MSKRISLCPATTRAGKRCKNSAKPEFGGFCRVHRQGSVPHKAGSMSVPDKVGVAANSIVVASAVINVVTFVSNHWDAIRNALSTMGIAFVTDWDFSTQAEVPDPQIRSLAAEAKRIWHLSSKILTGEVDSGVAPAQLKNDFAAWFKVLPEEVRANAEINAGKETIDRLLR